MLVRPSYLCHVTATQSMQREGDILERSPILIVFQLVINITLKLITFLLQPCKSRVHNIIICDQ